MGLETLALSASLIAVFASFIKVLGDFFVRKHASSITIKIGDRTIKLETTKKADLDKIIEALKENPVDLHKDRTGA
jgi:hypothetical protein